MKTMRPLLLMMTLLVSFTFAVKAQIRVTGTVWEMDNDKPSTITDVVIYKNKVFVTGARTDLEGNYTLSGLLPGNYEMEAICVGYGNYRKKNIVLDSLNHRVDFELCRGRMVMEMPIRPQKNSFCLSGQINFYIDCSSSQDEETEISKELKEPEKMITQVDQTLVFPNPTSDRVQYKSNQILEGLELRNLQGTILWTNPKGQSEGMIDLSSLTTGYYLMRYRIEDKFYTQKIVKVSG